MSTTILNAAMGLVGPMERLKILNEYGNMVDVDPKVSITRYYRSGIEMLRMADVYWAEGNHENAFILFMKYMTLFLHKIRKHPEFYKVKNDVKNLCVEIQKRILPLSEELRAKLYRHYEQEYMAYLAKREAERAKESENDRKRLKLDPSGSGSSIAVTTGSHGKVDPNMQQSVPDNLVYPNEFSNSAKRPRSEGLLYPTVDVEMDEDEEEYLKIEEESPYYSPFKRRYFEAVSLLAGSLRKVHIPTDTMDVFLKLAAENTLKNIETCGILAGQLNQNCLFITHMILPKQVGTPDSCDTKNEEEIFAVQNKLELITLGWIHTHPSQTAFLSSVDMHTQCGYQIMMPEAIAIVCAPKYESNGIFMLTRDYGLNLIAKCDKSGFHPHPNEPDAIFKTAEHTLLTDFQRIKVVDLRR